ncbi:MULTISPECIES: hypothetical protein [unclassified Streptomyces]|uniref:hypothetical protein n=2 Tax=Streptomyces TaxID=1883 RepID=UPI0024A837F7|nr:MULTISPECIES: hypothetical protein [unclassified Streptomyces]
MIIAMILARTLTLKIAARHPDRAVATEPLVNELRYKAVGTDLDVDPLPTDAEPPERAE